MDRAKLKRTVEAIEAAEQSIKDLSAHKRDLYAGVKDEFEPKVLRKIIQRRKLDPESRTRDDDLLDQYESALGMAGNLAKEVVAGERTYDEAAVAADVSRRTMARHVARAKGVPKATDDGTPHDADGVITEEEPNAGLSSSTGTDVKIAGLSDETAAKFKPVEPPVVTSTVAPTVSLGAVGASARRVATDNLEIPEFLRRDVLSAQKPKVPDERAEGAA